MLSGSVYHPEDSFTPMLVDYFLHVRSSVQSAGKALTLQTDDVEYVGYTVEFGFLPFF